MPSSSARPSAPPPLPSSLSARLQSTIDPLTGTCKHHPTVQLCQLVQDNTRWAVRRKVCIKCGSRTPVPVGGFDRRVPGKAVAKNPARNNGPDGVDRRGRSKSNLRSKSRPPSIWSGSVDRSGSSDGGGSGSGDYEPHRRRRSVSRPRGGNGSGDDEHHGRRRSKSRPRGHRRRDCDDKVKTVDIEKLSSRHQLAIVPQGNVRKQ
ncbi:hypothetical protein ACHAW5_007006 [Stephanodiscus triporus]|uniref:Uncharacterized protein n=1 Tax=Stephanodiscus triporus TaxID=2934178 RepID=A0ABD3NZ13_9STRA